MKVLHLSSEASWRGGEQQIAYLIDELDFKNVHNYVACRANSAFSDYCRHRNIEYIDLPFTASFDLASALKLKRYCKKHCIDIVHLHSSKGHSLSVLSSMLGNKSKLVLSRRVDFPIKNNWFSKFKYNYKKIKSIICVSNAIKTIILPSIKDKEKVTVIHSGIDLSKFEGNRNAGILHAEFNLKKNEKIIANISALAPHKDYFTFIDTAFHFLSNGNKAKFFIIGSGPLEQEIKDYVKSKGLEKDILFTGFRSDVVNIFPEIDVFLITSKTEGLGTTIIDAMANSVPVVATAGGGIPELVIHKQTGLLCKPMDFKSLSANLEMILQHDQLRSSLISQAKQLVNTQFTKAHTAQKTYEIYQSILTGA